MRESYYVCTACGHFWRSPHPPDNRRCESCARVKVTSAARDLYDAEEKSQRIIDSAAARS